MKSILIAYHCASRTGYAIGRLEPVFFAMALRLCDGDASRIHISYPAMDDGPSPGLPASFSQYLVFDPATVDPQECRRLQRYIEQHGIDTVFGFDQPVSRPLYRYLRAGGMRHFISYWGAPISSPFGGLRLLLKRIEVMLRRHGPDFYIFESQGMADTAIFGRGIPTRRVGVVYLSVDTERFAPAADDRHIVYDTFSIAPHRKVFFYSGHMEHRKGVHVLIKAARALVEQHGRRDFQLLILGNRNGEEQAFAPLLEGEHAAHVTFGGYRDDIPAQHRGCYAGLIGSTGWDSLTCSALEMAASGLPLLVSDLPGLRETVVHERTGYLFPAGDSDALARTMLKLLDDPATAQRLGAAARARALEEFSPERQQERLATMLRSACD
jgi:glycosyltransferase involved in cell wall biosynthesis